jgi:hypothetical protein
MYGCIHARIFLNTRMYACILTSVDVRMYPMGIHVCMDVFLNEYKCTYASRGNTCMHGCIHARSFFEYAYVWMCFLSSINVRMYTMGIHVCMDVYKRVFCLNTRMYVCISTNADVL